MLQSSPTFSLSWKKYKDALLHATFDKVPSVSARRCNFGKGGRTHQKKTSPIFVIWRKYMIFKNGELLHSSMNLLATNHDNAQKKGSKVGAKSLEKLDFLGKFTENQIHKRWPRREKWRMSWQKYFQISLLLIGILASSLCEIWEKGEVHFLKFVNASHYKKRWFIWLQNFAPKYFSTNS